VGEPAVSRQPRIPLAVRCALLAPALLADRAGAQEGPPAPSALEEVIVTAEKRPEDAQQVPISVQVLDSRKLEELHATSLDGYAKYLPSLSTTNYGPSQEQLAIRGLTNGAPGLSVGSLPTVAIYLDEQPVTTIVENLDVHIYDIARVEELSGPQGTLFGASSMAGTLRIITNQPDPSRFAAGYDLDGSAMPAGAPSGIAQGYLNLPLTDRAAIRLVGFTEHDGGYINNVLGPPEVYPTSGVVRSNAAFVKSDFNDVTTSGGRAALKIDLDGSWTVTPAFMYQNQHANGVPGYQPGLGDLNIAQYSHWVHSDRWSQVALTIQGKIANLDLVYAAAYLKRNVNDASDYSDYTYDYDVFFEGVPDYFGNLFRDNAGDLISPEETDLSQDHYSKSMQELRVTSPDSWPLRFVAGVFLQRQSDDTRNEIRVAGLADIYSITGEPGVQYLNAMTRTDRDRAVFGELTYDLTRKLSLTGGLREFGYDNTVYGFFGYNGLPVYGNGSATGGSPYPTGEQLCEPGSAAWAGPDRPCIDVDQRATKTGSTYKLNLSYHVDSDRLLYATWSTGFRPGGINRTKDAAPYRPDYLTNVEAGWKASWPGARLRFNGALFHERWKDAQYTICGPNCVFEIINSGGAAIRGIESELEWAATGALTLSGAFTWLDATLTSQLCRYGNAGALCNNSSGVADPTVAPLAVSGSPLPSPRRKGNLIARYTFRVRDLDAHLQAAGVAQSAITVQLPNAVGYGSLDLAAGVGRSNWSAEFYVRNALDSRAAEERFAPCGVSTCTQSVAIPILPRAIGLSFNQRF